MSDKIYIIGHKSPDLDSVAAAISLAAYRNNSEKTDKYVPAIAGTPNKETVYILDKFGFSLPEQIENLANKNVILVDHNETLQSADGVNESNLLEILDHHKLDFKHSEPIYVSIKPWGSSCTLVADLFIKNGLEIEKNLACLMLSAILVDTVITKSPTCTEVDELMINLLSEMAGIKDWRDFGMEIFKVRSDISDLSDEAIIKSDFKDFAMTAGKFGIGQVETADLSAFTDREARLLEKMNEMKNVGDYHSVILFLTDIINIGSKFLVVSSDMDKIKEALGVEFVNGQAYVPGIISRKKQVAPMFAKVFDGQSN